MRLGHTPLKLLMAAALLPAVWADGGAGSGTLDLQAVGIPKQESFNGLASTGTANTLLPAGFFLQETGTSASSNGQYRAGNGSANAGDTYSFGADGSSERAFGTLLSGTLTPIIGAQIKNATGQIVQAVSISYVGEQWRLGTEGRADRLDFQYSTNATSLTTGTWTDVDSLDFSSRSTTGATGMRDGNAGANQQALSATIGNLNLANGAVVWIRWTDFNAAGSDDGLAVDEIQITASDSIPPSGAGLATPGSVQAGGATLLTVQVTPGGSPVSSGLQVVADLSSIGGAASQPFFDSGINGDTAAGDNVFSFAATVGAAVAPGAKTLPATITDAQNRTGLASIPLTVTAAPGGTCSVTATIPMIQGNGAESPKDGQLVTTRGVVTGAVSNGFFIQTTTADADPLTSEGVFVFTGSGNVPAAAIVQNELCVTATVDEFRADENAAPITELVSPVTTLLASGTALPAAIDLTVANLSPAGVFDQLERYEGMRVSVASLRVVQPSGGNVSEANASSTSNGAFIGVFPAVARPFREPGIEFPEPLPKPTIDRFDTNPERIGVDSDRIRMNGQSNLPLNVDVGQTVSNLIGPLHFDSRTYTIYQDFGVVPTVSGNPLTATSVPVPGAGELTVGSANLFRFFDTVDDPGKSDVILTPAAFELRLKKVSLAIRNTLQSPDVLAVVEVENLSVLSSIAARLNADTLAANSPDPKYVAYLEEGNDIGGIDVGFLVKTSRVKVLSVKQEGKNTPFQTGLLNDRPSLVLDAVISRPGALAPFPFTVIGNHLRSLIGIDSPTDGPRVREKRALQAEFLANLVKTRLTANPAAKIILVGDFNAFEFNDGYVDVIGTIKGNPAPASEVAQPTTDVFDPDLVNLVDTKLNADQRYSFIFRGSAQVLDHVLVTQNLANGSTKLAFARYAADFRDVLRNDDTRPEKHTDHDAPIAYFTLPVGIPEVTAEVSVARSGFSFNRALQLFVGTVKITNNGMQTLAGPFHLLLRNLTAGVTLQNATGNVADGPYLTKAGTLAPGQTLTFDVQFKNPANAAIGYNPAVFAGSF